MRGSAWTVSSGKGAYRPAQLQLRWSRSEPGWLVVRVYLWERSGNARRGAGV
jgi:hypothetical protein